MYVSAVVLMFNLIGMAAIHYYNTSNLTVLPKPMISPSINPKPEMTAAPTYNSLVPTYTLDATAVTHTPTPYVSPYVLQQPTATPLVMPNFKISRLIEALDADRFDWTTFSEDTVSECCSEPKPSQVSETSILAASFPFIAIITYVACLLLIVKPN